MWYMVICPYGIRVIIYYSHSLQEFNIEKLHLLEGEKRKIRQAYERKAKQIDVRRKMWAYNCFGFTLDPNKLINQFKD